ncbi:MAG: hypothetical protein U0169_17500 [Polyangiaceae bacterium]
MASRTVLLRASWTASAWLVAAILGAGCSEKPQVGGKCPANRDGRLVCQDPTSALVCRGESWQALPCRGPQGCKAQGEKGEDVFCDHSIGTVGDRCLLDKDVVCGSDKTSVLVCSGGKFALSEACRGPKGCEVAGKQVRCDQSTAVPGEPCAEDKALGCAADAKAVLTCKDKKFTVTRTCKEPKGTVAEDKKSSATTPSPTRGTSATYPVNTHVPGTARAPSSAATESCRRWMTARSVRARSRATRSIVSSSRGSLKRREPSAANVAP